MTSHRSALAAVLLAGALAVAPVAASSAAPAKAKGPTAADCAGCHESADKPVKADALKGSVHEGLACTDCHSDIKDLPHADKPAKADCSPCHAQAVTDWKASPHAAKPGGATCASCHGSHQITAGANEGSMRRGIRQVQVCGACHAKHPGPHGGTGEAWIMNYRNSVHGDAVLNKGMNVAPSCATCHGAHALRALGKADAASKVKIAELCGTCHAQAFASFRASAHYAALQKGSAGAPSCTDCHGEHTIQGPQGPGSPVAPLAVPQTCGKCHADKSAMENFGLPSDRVATYTDSYHGIALKEGDLKAANCASCHENHGVLPASDPASSINPANLEKTCGKCHPKAGKGFSQVKFHQAVSPQGARGAWFVRVFYIGFIGILILGFVLHILAEMFARAKGRKVVR
jgi:hypothetical protein